MEKSTKMVSVLVVVLSVLAAATEARNLKTTEAASKDAVLQPTTFPPFDRLPGSASPAFGGLPGSSGGSSIPGFSLPGSGGATPGFGSIGSMPFLGGSSLPGMGGSSLPGMGGIGGGMPGSPAAGAVDEHAKNP